MGVIRWLVSTRSDGRNAHGTAFEVTSHDVAPLAKGTEAYDPAKIAADAGAADPEKMTEEVEGTHEATKRLDALDGKVKSWGLILLCIQEPLKMLQNDVKPT